MAAEPLWTATAAELARLVNRREVSPVEVVEAHAARVQAAESRLQAWETLDVEGALRAAREIERRAEPLPLKGVPVGVKDIYQTAGLRTTASFAPFGNRVPDTDAEAVRRLRQAGAIVLGKTVTTQFALADPPRTRNPWKADRTPGGSSSGSAAAVAARTVPLALGTQTKGSVLRPAAYCGAIGFKPTFGRISRRGVFPLAWSFDTMGFICRTMEDAALTLSVLAGHDAADPSSAARPVEDFAAEHAPAPAAPPRLGLVVDFVDRADGAVAEHLRQAAGKLRAAGAEIVELRLPLDFDTVNAAHDIILHVEAAAVHGHLLAREAGSYAPMLRAAIEAGLLIPAASYVQAQRIRRRFRTAMGALLNQADALLTPTASNLAPGPETTGDPSFQAPWTQLGLPALSLPTGLDSASGLPAALQLATGPFQEGRLIRLGRWAEDVLGPAPIAPL